LAKEGMGEQEEALVCFFIVLKLVV